MKRQYPARLKKFFDHIGIKIDSMNVLESREELNKQSVVFFRSGLKERKLGTEFYSDLYRISEIKTTKRRDHSRKYKELL